MPTIKQMREDLATAYQNGYTDEVRRLSGIDGAPKDALEVVQLWMALRAAKGDAYAPDVCIYWNKWRKDKI